MDVSDRSTGPLLPRVHCLTNHRHAFLKLSRNDAKSNGLLEVFQMQRPLRNTYEHAVCSQTIVQHYFTPDPLEGGFPDYIGMFTAGHETSLGA